MRLMLRFTIRDLLMLMALAAICVTWLMDRDKIRRERNQLAKREAELTSENKMWQAEADRASLRQQHASQLSRNLELVLRGHGIDPNEANDPKKVFQYRIEMDKAMRAKILEASRKDAETHLSR